MKFSIRFPLFAEAGDGGQANGGASQGQQGSQGGGSAGAQTPAFREQVFQPDGSFSQDWHRHLGDEFKDAAPQLSRFKSFSDFTKSFLHSQRQLSAGRPQMPDEKSTPEQVKAWRDHLGLPEDENAWNIAKPDKLPEGAEWNEPLAKGLSEWAKANHVNPKSLPGLVAKYNELQEGSAKSQAEKFKADALIEFQKGEKALKDTWGGEYEKNLALAKRAAATAGLDANHYALTDPDVVKALHRLAVATGEGKLVQGGNPTLTGDPKTQADLIQTDSQNPHYAAYHNPQHPQHKATREMVLNLRKQGAN